MSLVPTFGHYLYESGARGTKGRYNPDSKITPSCPLVDGWERGTFNPDGLTFKDRYGFSLEETNGSSVGEAVRPEGAFTDVVHDLSNPFMIEDNQHYVVSTFWDVLDAQYVMAGEQTAYAALIVPIIQKLASVSTGENGSGSNVGSGSGVGSSSGIGNADDSAEVASLKSQLALLQTNLWSTTSQRDAATGLISQVNKVLKGIAIPPRGGGAPTAVLRKIANIMQGLS